ncbi:MAG: DNA-binding response OmpR family regulator [Bradymonadia bacterium]|jgi:DNA-binding response OmpR family regulator
MSCILLIEDDEELAELTARCLRRDGFVVEHQATGDGGLEAALSSPPDLVLLDVMLPGLDGFGVLRALRPRFDGPILMLTARDDDIDEVVGLELGADDYLTKPVRPRVLVARVRAALRRAQRSPEPIDAIILGDLAVAPRSREVTLRDQPITLTTAEFDVLLLLAQRAGTVVSRDDIYREVLGSEYDGLDRAADVYVSRLRSKLGDDPRAPRRLKTVRGAGYLLAPGHR